MPVAADLIERVLLYGQMALAADGFEAIRFGPEIKLPLGVNEDLLFAFGVFKPQLVEAIAALGAGRLEARSRLIRGQIVGWNLFGVIYAPGDERPVRVAFEELHHHLLPHPWNADRSPPFAGPGLCYPHPAGAGLLARLAVPVKVHAYPAVLVRPDLFSITPHHHRRLRSLNDRLRRQACWSKWRVGRNTANVIHIVLRSRIVRVGSGHRSRVFNLCEDIFLADLRTITTQPEARARGES